MMHALFSTEILESSRVVEITFYCLLFKKDFDRLTMIQPHWLRKLREVFMKKFALLLVCVAALAFSANLACAADTVIADFDNSDPFVWWGVGSWQVLSETVVTDPDIIVGATGKWLQLGVGAWGQGTLIVPRWNDWGVATVEQYNSHSSISFDAVIYGDQWSSDSLAFEFAFEATGIPQTGTGWQLTDISDAKVTYDEDSGELLTGYIKHITISYESIGYKPDTDQNNFQMYLKFADTAGTGSIVYLDNITFTGVPLPVPEPGTFVLLAMAGLAMWVLRRR
jgi:hypothetical protein